MHPKTPRDILWKERRQRHRPRPHAWRSPRERERSTTNGTYRLVVPASPEARRDAFSRFVNRALAQAKQSRGWSIPKVAEISGVGVNTIYRWVRADWREFPKGELVEQFCDALDIPAAAAFSILWPGKSNRPAPPEPLPTEPEFDELMRKLRDPNVPETEKYLIRETIRGLASRPNRPAGIRKDRRAG